MTDKIILVCCAIFLPLGLFIINKLLDRTTIKEKDNTIAELKSTLSVVASQTKTSSAVSGTVKDIAQAQVENSQKSSDLLSEAKKVTTLEEALELAKKQTGGEK